eukprot:4667587-Prymnesium_polylepis.2
MHPPRLPVYRLLERAARPVLWRHVSPREALRPQLPPETSPDGRPPASALRPSAQAFAPPPPPTTSTSPVS